MTGDRSLRDYDFDNGDEDVIDDPLVFLAQPDSLIVTREFADRNRLRSGDRISFDTMEGRKQFTIRGILKAGGMASAFGGNLGIMDIYAAQKVFGRGRRFDRIDIGLQPGVTLEQGEAALRRALVPGLTVEPPSGRGRQFESLLGVYTAATGISSVFALFIGMFIIYNSFSIAVTQRRPEIGILRALGATRGQIRTLFLGESAVAGLIGSSLGAALGLSFARSLTGVTGQLMDQMFGVPNNTQEVLVDPRCSCRGGGAGCGDEHGGGVHAGAQRGPRGAHSGAAKGPVPGARRGGEPRPQNLALIATAIGLACLPFAEHSAALYVGFLLTVLAGLLLTPFLSLELAKLLRRPLKWLRPMEGALAADSLIQAPRRTSATVAALMLSLALVIAQGGMARASVESFREWMEGTLNPDLFVTASSNLAATDFRFPGHHAARIAGGPGHRRSAARAHRAQSVPRQAGHDRRDGSGLGRAPRAPSRGRG